MPCGRGWRSHLPVFVVSTGSPLKTGKDLLERLKSDPQSVAMGFPTALGQNQVGAALLLKAIGRNAREVQEWKADLEKNYWSDDFASSDQFRKDLGDPAAPRPPLTGRGWS